MPKELKFQFIRDHRRSYPIEPMCQVIQVLRCDYYAWHKRKLCARKMANATILVLIRLHCRRNRGVYGSPRIYHRFQVSANVLNQQFTAVRPNRI